MFFSVQGQVAERKAIWGSLAETRGSVCTQNILNGPTFHVFLPFNALNQGSPNLFLEGRCPAEFSSNPNQTHLNQLIKVLLSILETSRQVCWGKLELNSAGHRPSRTECGDPCFKLSWMFKSARLKTGTRPSDRAVLIVQPLALIVELNKKAKIQLWW